MAWMTPIIIASARRREEEELLEQLKRDDPSGKWEFKIVHGTLGIFNNVQRLGQLQEEEALAEWEMIQMLDGERVVFRRARSARERDHLLEPGTDPYRTEYGTSSVALLVVVMIVLLGIMMAALFALMLPEGNGSGAAIPAVLIMIGLVVLGAVVIAARVRR